MPFVFVSHASQDKPRIRHVVDALIAEGHKVWLDNPDKMGYDVDQIRSCFHRLHAGGRWHDQIDEAIRESSVVLVCFSARFKEQRDVWHGEVSTARTLRKLVACRIDDIDTRDLYDQFSLEQIPNVKPERNASELANTLKLLMDDVRRKLSETINGGVERRRQWKLDPDAPYLVDRADQEEMMGEGIAHVDLHGGVRAFCVAGPENECVDEFLARVEKFTCPERLNERLWYTLNVPWPEHKRGPDFSRTFLSRCAGELGHPRDAGEAAVAGALANIGKPVAVLSRLTASEWREDEKKRICDWLEVWHRLASQPVRFCAVPILRLTMPPAEPGWKTYPPGTAPGAAQSNAAIWRAIEAVQRGPGWWQRLFAGSQPERAAICLPPLLHPITKAHVDDWLYHKRISPQLGDDRTDIKAGIRTLFGAKPAVPLQSFADTMNSLFKHAT